MDTHRLLCAHRDGPYGVAHWNRLTERLLAEHDQAVWQEWYAGRPMLVTANDYGLGLFNGDTGVVVREGDRLRGVIAGVGDHLWLATARLGAVETLHAMTIHKSQGSQVGEVTLLLPAGGLPAAHPRALLHRGDPGQGAGARRRHAGGGGRRGRAAGPARDRAGTAPRRRLTRTTGSLARKPARQCRGG